MRSRWRSAAGPTPRHGSPPPDHSSRWCGRRRSRARATSTIATSRDSGRSFDAPVRVNAVAGDARVSGEIAPRVLAAIGGGCGAGDRSARGTHETPAPRFGPHDRSDGGRTFAAPSHCRRRAQPAIAGGRRRRWMTRGIVHTIWLDHRGMAAGKAAGSCRPQGRSRRRGHGAEISAVLRSRAASRRGARALQGRVLLLQDRDGRGARRCDLRRMASRLRGQPPRHRIYLLARRRQDVLSA